MVLDKCLICGKEFDRRGRAKTCSNPECKNKYKTQYHKQYYEANRDKRLEYQKQWYEANRDKQLEYNKQYYEANRDKRLEYNKQWYEANRDKKLEYQKQRYEKAYVELSQIADISIEDLKSYIPPMFIERELACWDKGSYFLDFIVPVNERAGGKCELTGKKSSDLRVHHLDGYNWCIEGRINPNNAVCIDKDVHKAFHDKYGRGDNTREQWEEFKANYQNKTVTLDKWL